MSKIEELKQQALAKFAADQQNTEKPLFPTETVTLISKGLNLYPENHVLNGGEIVIKYMTAKEEDILSNVNYIQNKTVFDVLLKSVIVSPIFNLDDLLICDKGALLVAVRIIGLGKDLEQNLICKGCNKPFKATADLSKLSPKAVQAQSVGVNCFRYTLPQTKRAIEFKLLNVKEAREIQQEVDKFNNRISATLKRQITSVDGQTDKGYIAKFVDNELFTQDSRALRKYMAEVSPDIDSKQTFTHGECGHTDEYDIEISPVFFWSTEA